MKARIVDETIMTADSYPSSVPFWSPGAISHTSTNASDIMTQQSSVESGSSSIATPLLNCEPWALEDELRGFNYIRFRLGMSAKESRIRLAVFTALILGLLLVVLARFDPAIFGAVTHLRMRGSVGWSSRGTTVGKRVEITVHNRSVLIYMPRSGIAASNPLTPLPAVVVLHGSEDTNSNIAKTTRFEEVAERENLGFLVVYPEMKTAAGEMWGYDDPNEISFFRALPKAVAKAGYPIDFAKVFVSGHSCGGSMSLFLQNNHPDIFRGAAAVEAGVGHLGFWRNQSLGRPSLVVWNHNDEVLNEYGGENLYRDTLQQLRRHDPFGAGVGPNSATLITGHKEGVMYAERLRWGKRGKAPPLEVISWRSQVPTHNWANPQNVPGAFDSASIIWEFFRNVLSGKADAPSGGKQSVVHSSSHMMPAA